MRPIEIILKGIVGNVTEFKRLCEAKVCSPELLKDLDRALMQGSVLSADIDTVMTHLLDLKQRLEKSEKSA